MPKMKRSGVLAFGSCRPETEEGMTARNNLGWLWVLTAVASIVFTGCEDRISFSNGSSGENGLLVDGAKSGTHRNDDRFTGPAGSAIKPGSFTSSGQSNELIAYTNHRPPTLRENAPWSDGDDHLSLTFENKYRVPFVIWIVKGPFDTQRSRAISACVKTSQIWSDERQGIGFSRFDVNDATGDPDASSFQAFTCSKASNIKSQIGFDSSAFNVYYVDTVDFSTGPGTGKGVWCGAAKIVAMGRNTSDHLFSHEIGHGFALGHVNSLTTFFDTTNVMHNASNNRNYLTEGQTFRAVINGGSAVNTTFGLRPGLTTRNCSHSTSTTDNDCPSVR